MLKLADFDLDQDVPSLLQIQALKWTRCVWCRSEIAWEEIYCPYCGHEPFPPAQDCECKTCKHVRKLWRQRQRHNKARMINALKSLWPKKRGENEDHKQRHHR